MAKPASVRRYRSDTAVLAWQVAIALLIIAGVVAMVGVLAASSGGIQIPDPG